MIPERIDLKQLLADINSAGWRDYKIELATGVAREIICRIKSGKTKHPRYEIISKLYNFREVHCELSTEHSCVNVDSA